MTRPSLVGVAPPHHVTEDTPIDLFEGSMDLLVVLPNDKCVPMSFERKLALMDVLMQIGNAHKFSPGGHVLEIADSLGNNLQCKPSTRLGSLNAHTVYVVARNRINDRLKAKVFKAIPHQETEKTQQPFENTFRVQVRLPRNQLHVIRAAWRTPLSQIVNQVCQERGLDPQKYQLRHPVRLDECLDLNRSLGDYQLQEVCLVSQGESGSSHFSPSDLSAMKKVTKSPSSDINSVNAAEKKRRSLFGFVFGKKPKSTVGDANTSSSDTNVVASPLRSEEPVASPPEAEVAVPTQAAAVTPTPPSPVLVSKRLAEEAVAKRNSRLMMLGTLANNHVSNVQQDGDQSQQPQPKPPARMKKKAAAPPPPSATISTTTTAFTTIVETTPSKNGSQMAGSVVSVSSGSSESTIVSSPASVLPRSGPGSEVGSDLSGGYDRPTYRRSAEPPSPAKRPVGGSRNTQSISDLSAGAKKSVPARTSLSNLTQVNSTSELSLSSASKKRKAPPPPPVAAPVAASKPAEKPLAASAAPVVPLAAPVAASEPSVAQQVETTKASPPAATSSPASVVAAPRVAPKPSVRKKWKHSSSSSSSLSNSDDFDVEDLDMFTSKTELENRKTGENISLVSSEDDLEECVIVHQAQDATKQWDLSSEQFPELLIGGVFLDIPLLEKRLSVSSRSEFYSISSHSSVRSSSSDSESEIQEMQMKLLLQRQKNKEAIPADLSMIPIEELRDLNDTSPDDTKSFRRSLSEVNFSPEDSGLLLSTSPIRSQSYTISGQTSVTPTRDEPRWTGFNDLPFEEALASFQIKGWTRQTGRRSSVSSEDSTNDRTLTNPNEHLEKEPTYGTITSSPVFDRDAAKVEILSDIPVSEALYAMVVKKPKSIQPVVKESPSKNVEKRSRTSSSSSSDDSSEEDVPEPLKDVPEPAETVLEGFSSVEKVPEPKESTPVVPERTESVPENVESVPNSPVMWNHQLPQPPPMFQDDQSDSEASNLDISIDGSETGSIPPIGSSSSGKEPVENVLTEVSGTSEVPLTSVTLSMGSELEQETATDDLIPAEPGTIVLDRDPYGESTTEDVAIPPPELDCKNQSSSSESDTEPSERDSLDEEDPAEHLENPEIPGSPSTGSENSMEKSAAPDSPVKETVTEKLEAPSLLAFFSQAQSSLNSTADPAAKALQEELQRLQQQFLAWQQNQQPQPKQQKERHTSSSSSSSRDTESESDDDRISKKKSNKRKAKGKKRGSRKAEEEEEEEEQKRKEAEEMMKKKEEEEEMKRKEEEDKKKREEEERVEREEEERLKREMEEKKKREEEKRLKKEERMKREEEERKKMEEKERLKKEEKERKRREKEEKKRKEEEEGRRKKEEEDRKKGEEEEKLKKEEEMKKRREEEEEERLKKEEDERKKREEEQRKKKEEEQKKRKEEEENLKKEEEKRKREEEDKLKNEEEKKRREEETKLQKEEEEGQRRLKEEQSKEEIRDKMLKLLETEELVLAEREKELQKQREALVTEKSSRHASSSSSSSDSSDNESSDVVIRREPVYRYRGPPQVKLEPWKPGRPRSEVIDLSTELTYDIPAPLLAKQSDIPVSDISFPSGPKSASRDSPDSGIGGYDSLPTIPVSSPVKPEPPAKSENLFRKTSADIARPFATNSAPLNFKRMSFVPLVNPVPSVQRKISSGPEVRGFSSLTFNELPRLNRIDSKPEVSRKPGATLQLSKTVVRSSNTVIQEEDGTKAIKQEISEQAISDDFTKVDFRQKISMFEKPRLRPVSMPLISSQHVNNVETTPVQKSTAAPRRITPAKFAQSPTDPRDDLLKSIRDFSSGYSLKKTGISLN